MRTFFPALPLTSFGLAAMIVIGAPVAAETISVRVRLPDANAPHAGQVLRRRLDRAVLAACGASEFSLREVRDATRASDCYHMATRDALRQIGDPRLAAVIEPLRCAGMGTAE